MRRTLLTIAGLAACLGGPLSAAASVASAASGPKRVARAVARAERSRDLWATVNVCTRSGRGGVMGVRGEMPALGLASTLRMTVALNRYSTTSRSFVAVPGATATRTVTLGRFRSHVHQGGVEFPFSAPAGLLDATVTFSWLRGRTVLGSVSRTTTGGHPRAAFGRPAHHSAPSCRIG